MSPESPATMCQRWSVWMFPRRSAGMSPDRSAVKYPVKNARWLPRNIWITRLLKNVVLYRFLSVDLSLGSTVKMFKRRLAN